MRPLKFQRWQIDELLISLFVFFTLTVYIYAILFVAPYPGFSYNISNGQIVEIYAQSEQTLTLQLEDKLVQIGTVSWEGYIKDSRLVFFENVKTGEIVEIVVNRNGTEIAIPWKFSGFNQSDFLTRFFNIWWLAILFWIAGTITQVLIRPRDLLRNLFVALNYLTALWIIFGSLSSRHIWESSILLRAVTWLILPVYLHFHWMFPHPLKPLPKTFWGVFYLVCLGFALAETFQVLPKSLYALVFLIALLGSFTLQVIHYRKHEDQRRDIRLLAIAIAIAFLPSIVIGVLITNGSAANIAMLGLFSLPLMPLAYFYAIYRRSMGGLEIRLNRIISIYTFLILVGIVLSITLIPLTNLNLQVENVFVISIVVILALVYIAISIFSSFQSFVERRYLGISIDTKNLAQNFSNLIVTNTTMDSLLDMLEEKVFPSLLIRQYAVVQVENHHLNPLLMKNVTQAQLPEKEAISKLHSIAGQFIPNLSADDDWLRLVLPLKLGDSTLGFFLLGSRDPDDIYHQQEIPELQSIANQTAIALSNIAHAQALSEMYKSGLERYEQERLRLGQDLHDIVLNDLSELRKSLGEKEQQVYEELTERLREIVKDLKPPMLITYGLEKTISGLAEDLMQKTDDNVKIIVDIVSTGERLPENIEIHLFRIVQEACKNSLKHSQCNLIKIYGSVSINQAQLIIEDNGNGFELEEKGKLDVILANRHFGLVGMRERAHVIGAKLDIESKPYTKIQVTWADEKVK